MPEHLQALRTLVGQTIPIRRGDEYIPQVRVVGAVFYAELFNLWSHLSNKFGQFLCSLHCLCVNCKIKQLSLVGSELHVLRGHDGAVETDYRDGPSAPSCILALCDVTLQLCPGEVSSPLS